MLGEGNDSTVQVSGLEELSDTFRDLIKKYPDRAGQLLQKEGRALRKDVTIKVKQRLNTSDKSKMSLAKVGNYRVTQPKGVGTAQYVEVIAKSPHFHLIENGHEIVTPTTRTITLKNGSKKKIKLKNGGQHKGFAAGYKLMDESAREHQASMPDVVEDMVDALLREGGLV